MAREMKDSGIAWIGKIPAEWQVAKAKYYIVIQHGTDPKLEGDIPVYGSGASSFKTCGEYKNGPTVLVGRKGATLHIPHYIEGKYWNVDTAFDVHANPDMYLRYYYYCAICFDYKFYISQTTLPGMTQTNYENMFLPIPSFQKQKAITDFLDYKCGEIDHILKLIQISIEKYKELKQAIITQAVTKGIRGDRPMKDSGIPWIGAVPSDWNVTRFSRMASVKSNLVSPHDYLDFPQVSPENIEKGNAKLLPCKTVRESGVISGNHLFFEGQILYSKIRPKLNKVCIAPFSGLCSADMYPVETTHNTKFVVYCMLSDSFVSQVSMITEDRVKMPKINQDELGSLMVAYPSNEAEQQEIVEYLDEKCAMFDNLIERKQSLLAMLETYKKSLIYEYVTGKKEVPLE